VALILGMLVSTRLQLDTQWTIARSALLGIAVLFGLLLLVGVSPSVAPIAIPAGLSVALTTAWATQWRRFART
jgi:hypothetical protein